MVIRNDFDPLHPGQLLPVEKVFLYQPFTEWTYSHHPSITFFKGRFYAMWSNGRHDEDAPGQRVLLASSADFTHWTAPRPLLDVTRGEHSDLVLTAAGFHVHGDTLNAYVAQYEYDPAHLQPDGSRKQQDLHHQHTAWRVLTSTDGTSWSQPLDLGLPIVPNHPPQVTRSGRLIVCGNISFPWTDDPSGLSGWQQAGIYPPTCGGPVVDDSESFNTVARAAGWPAGLCEGSFYQTDDGILHMLLRSGQPRLWHTQSTNDGQTWSPPTPTEFSDNAAKFHFGRLPDGRFYYVGNPDPAGARLPLALYLSRDGVRFDEHYVLGNEPYIRRTPGLYKGGNYGYPHSLLHDGWLYVIFSQQKEAIAVVRVRIADLNTANATAPSAHE